MFAAWTMIHLVEAVCQRLRDAEVEFAVAVLIDQPVAPQGKAALKRQHSKERERFEEERHGCRARKPALLSRSCPGVVIVRNQRDNQPCLIYLACHLFGCTSYPGVVIVPG